MSFDLKKTNVPNLKKESEDRSSSLGSDYEDKIQKERNLNAVSWRAPEFEVYEKSATWYAVSALVLLGIAAYAMFINAPLMAITFILIGVVGYLYLQKEPRILDFSISYKGVQVGKEIYEFDNIEAFWIFYDPPHTKTLSLHTKTSFMPFVHIPLADEDPVVVREALLAFIPEEKQEAGFVDALERFLHI